MLFGSASRLQGLSDWMVAALSAPVYLVRLSQCVTSGAVGPRPREGPREGPRAVRGGCGRGRRGFSVQWHGLYGVAMRMNRHQQSLLQQRREMTNGTRLIHLEPHTMCAHVALILERCSQQWAEEIPARRGAGNRKIIPQYVGCWPGTARHVRGSEPIIAYCIRTVPGRAQHY